MNLTLSQLAVECWALSVERWALKKIGIYGGSFDPIHHAHLILARAAKEQLQLEKVIFVPAAVSPFKDAPTISAEQRLLMLKTAIADEPGFAVDDCELRRPPPSYTFDTVSDIRQREPGVELYYLVGEDNVPGLSKWHRFKELEKLAHFVVLDRSGNSETHPYETVRRKIDISATEIRNRVASGLSIRYLVPTAVEEMIKQGNFYRGQVK